MTQLDARMITTRSPSPPANEPGASTYVFEGTSTARSTLSRHPDHQATMGPKPADAASLPDLVLIRAVLASRSG